MSQKLLFCLALVLSGGLVGCSTAQLSRQDAVSYFSPTSDSLQKVKIERIFPTGEQLSGLASLPKDKTEFGSRWLVEEKADTMRDGPWNTRLYIFDSADTNRCVRVELLDRAGYEVHHSWLNEITSHIFGIEGKIVRIRETPGVLKSITVKLIKPLPTALGWIPYDKPGESVVIHFDESLSKLGKLHLATGDTVKVAFGNGIQSLRPDDLGSNFSWLYVEKNGRFYNTKGEIVDSVSDENL